jgi:hypothetical protein
MKVKSVLALVFGTPPLWVWEGAFCRKIVEEEGQKLDVVIP